MEPRNHRITRAEAIAQTGRYRKNKEKILAEGYKGKAILPICETFDRAAFDDLLKQKGCTGIRVYYGMNDMDDVHLIMVGVDAEGRDMLPDADQLAVATEDSTDAADVIIENGARCPTACPEPSPLNH